jgi:hypothetical protein
VVEERRFRGARAVSFSLLLGFVLQLSACTSDPEPPSPPQGCRDFVDAFCSRLAECELPSERARTYQNCVFSFELSIDCDQVFRLRSSYDACMSEIENASCELIQNEFPASCKGVLLDG